ncbi:hypothetical protein D0884_26520 (plasmid) [Klebsiella pneumoniae]|nr:hypothetical protein D0884_26520 [Klebsiella pneumoniae]
MEEDNYRLILLVADLSLDKEKLQDVIRKKTEATQQLESKAYLLEAYSIRLLRGSLLMMQSRPEVLSSLLADTVRLQNLRKSGL